jgi:hypothetical protein
LITANGNAAQSALGGIVVERQPAVVVSTAAVTPAASPMPGTEGRANG